MFTFELEKYGSKVDCFSGQAAHDKFSRGFEFIQEPESVRVGVSTPEVAPEYDDMRRMVVNWEGIRAANSPGLRSAVLMRNGVPTGEAGLAQCLVRS